MLDAEYEALLRLACLKAAGVGALSALAGALPGAGVLLRLVAGELADVAAVESIQETLIADVFDLYGLHLPRSVREPLVAQIATLGAGAGLGVDVLGRKLLGRFGGRLAGRLAPLAAVLTSAIGNAAATYAIGQRAQAFTRLREAPVENLAEAMRAFTGVDERRLWEWSVGATRETLGRLGSVLRRFLPETLLDAVPGTAGARRRSAAGARSRKPRP